MAQYLIRGETLDAIADSTRRLDGLTQELTPLEMNEEISSAVAEVQQQSTIINRIKEALQDKTAGGGVELPSLTSPGAAEDLVQGKQLIDGDGNVVDGTLVVPTLADLTAGTSAVAGDLISGETAYSNGQLITGTYVPPTVADLTADATAVSADIISGKTAYVNGEKITGSHVCTTVADLTADADATAGDIASGKTAYVDGVKVTGTGQLKAGEPYAELVDLPRNITVTLNIGNYTDVFIIIPISAYDDGCEDVCYHVKSDGTSTKVEGGYPSFNGTFSISNGVLSMKQTWTSTTLTARVIVV